MAQSLPAPQPSLVPSPVASPVARPSPSPAAQPAPANPATPATPTDSDTAFTNPPRIKPAGGNQVGSVGSAGGSSEGFPWIKVAIGAGAVVGFLALLAICSWAYNKYQGEDNEKLDMESRVPVQALVSPQAPQIAPYEYNQPPQRQQQYNNSNYGGQMQYQQQNQPRAAGAYGQNNTRLPPRPYQQSPQY